MKAYELADFLEKNMMASVAILGDVTATHIVATLRQQAERIEELEKRPAINKEDGLVCAKCYGSFKQNPLSYEEIHDIWKSLWEGGNIGHIAYNYARAIEERHGIK